MVICPLPTAPLINDLVESIESGLLPQNWDSLSVKEKRMVLEDTAKKSLHVGKIGENGSMYGYVRFNRKAGYYIIEINPERPKYEQLFTLGHELGHTLLHLPRDCQISLQYPICLQQTLSSISGIRSRPSHEEDEEADYFALRLLHIGKYVPRVRLHPKMKDFILKAR